MVEEHVTVLVSPLHASFMRIDDVAGNICQALFLGSFDFIKQMSGLICCYSLKNPR